MTPWKVILCPIDFSASSERVVEVAAHVAAGERGRLVLLHVTDAHGELRDGIQVTPEGGGAPVDLAHYARESALHALEQRAEALRARGHEVQCVFASGAVVPAILQAADDLHADLLVMGTHGRRGLAHVLLGSVAERVLRAARIPVLTVRQAKGDEARPTAAEDVIAAERDG